jgi:ferritin
MRVQAQEEVAHAMRIFDYLNERGGRAVLGAIQAPATKWDSPLAAFEAAYAHEQKVTGMIRGLADLASAEKDHAAGVFLQWFVSEQVEEEAAADLIVQMLKRIGDSSNGLFMLDHQLGERKAE